MTYQKFQPQKSAKIHQGLDWFTDAAAAMGLLLRAGKGSGKSTILCLLAFLNWLKGHGQLLIDPLGGTIDRLLDQLIRYGQQLEPEARQRLWERIRYVEFSGKYGHIVPWPLLYRIGNESYNVMAQRYLELVARIDPKLKQAPIQGWNPFSGIAERGLMILAAMEGLQITELESLLRGAKNKNATWKQCFAEAAKQSPEVAEAVRYFEMDYAKMNAAERKRLSGSLLTKLRTFSLEPSMRAIFGATKPGIDWTEVVEKGLLVLADFRHVNDTARKRFLTLMLFLNFVGFVEKRGIEERDRPLWLICDELTAFTNQDLQSEEDLFANDLDTLINVTARNCGLRVVFALQESWQVSERILNSLHSCANLIQGVSSDPKSAIDIANQLFPYDPRLIKSRQPVYAGNPPEIIDFRDLPFSPAEWSHFSSQAIRQLKPFRFLVKGGAKREGDFTGAVEAMSIEYLLPTIPVDKEKVAWVRRQLALRDGRPIPEVLKEIEQRQNQPISGQQSQVKPADQSATLAGNAPADTAPDHLQTPTETNGKGDEHDFWHD